MRGPSGLTSKQEARLQERFEEDRRRFRREDLPRILAEAQGSLERLEGDPIQGDLGRRFRVLRDLLAAWDRGAADLSGLEGASLAAALQYLTTPGDLLPDFLPLVGYRDDRFVADLAAAAARDALGRYVPSEMPSPARGDSTRRGEVDG